MEKGDDKSRGEQFVAMERKISEFAEFRSQMQSKYSAASPRALDYIMMMKGEHSLLEFLRNLELDVNFSRNVDQETEFVTCTWWRPKNPKNAQPLLYLKMYVGPDLYEAPETHVMFAAANEADGRAIWALVPNTSFLRRGLQRESVVEKFVQDKEDSLLETMSTSNAHG